MIKLKRAYDPASKEDGYRILVERLWPRGVTKEKAGLDAWLKEIAPSPGLRKWFGHDPQKWNEFKTRYRQELKDNAAGVKELKGMIESHDIVTFVYAAKDEEHNSAVLLKEFLGES